MGELVAILWLLAAVFGVWQLLLGIGAILVIARGDRVTGIGIAPGIIAVALAIVAILL